MDELIDGMLTLKRVLRRERQQKLLVLGMAFLATFLLGLLGYVMERGNAFFVILGIATLLGGLRFLRDILREWQPEKSAVMQRLHRAPKSIVWIYVIHIRVMPLGIRFWNNNTLSIRLVNGEELQVRANEKDMQLIKKALLIMLPHATFGHSREREQWYSLDPKLLYREKDKE